MTPRIIAFTLAATLGLSACNDPAMQNTVGTGVAAGTIGAIAATALGADTGWAVAAGIAAGTAGALYARNRENNQCAYHTGNTLPNGEPEVSVSQCR
jgi:uncharacterized membrane protein YhhN